MRATSAFHASQGFRLTQHPARATPAVEGRIFALEKLPTRHPRQTEAFLSPHQSRSHQRLQTRIAGHSDEVASPALSRFTPWGEPSPNPYLKRDSDYSRNPGGLVTEAPRFWSRNWLCSALYLYFSDAPARLLMRAEKLPENVNPVWTPEHGVGFGRFVGVPVDE